MATAKFGFRQHVGTDNLKTALVTDLAANWDDLENLLSGVTEDTDFKPVLASGLKIIDSGGDHKMTLALTDWAADRTLTFKDPTGADNVAYEALAATLANKTLPGATTTLAGLALGDLVAGDTLYGSAADTLARLAKGTDGEVLTLASGIPSWAAAVGKFVQIPALAVGTTSSPSTTSTSYQDMDEMTVTLTTTKGGLIAIMVCTNRGAAAGQGLTQALLLDAAGESAIHRRDRGDTSDYGVMVTFNVWTGVSNASHTIKGRYKSDGTNAHTLDTTQRRLFVMEFDD